MRIETVGNVAFMRMNAGKANAFSPKMVEGLSRLLDELDRNEAPAVVMTGYDNYFSAGLDIPTLLGFDRDRMTDFIHGFADVMIRIFCHPKPVVAAINGHAVAGGCVLAIQCDYRIMAAGETRLGLSETQLGVGLPGLVIETMRCQFPCASFLPAAIEGRLFTPEEALKLGLVHETAPPKDLEARATRKANELASIPREAFIQVKEAIRRPAVEAYQRNRDSDARRWLDTWFSKEARKRLAQTAEQLATKRKTSPAQ